VKRVNPAGIAAMLVEGGKPAEEPPSGDKRKREAIGE
jgi:hypothetical protein